MMIWRTGAGVGKLDEAENWLVGVVNLELRL